MKVGIIGAGASGLFLASMLSKLNIDYSLFERNDRCGKKLLATGNGRCNLSNSMIDISRYHGDTSFAQMAIERYPLSAMEDFFFGIGLTLCEENGKIYPKSLEGKCVLEFLRLSLKNSEIVNAEVKKITKKKDGYTLNVNGKEEFFDKVVVAVGGKASPNLSGGGAYNLLKDLGYDMTELKPAIVQLKTKGTKALTGIKAYAKVTLGEKEETGEVLFTDYGLSGPPILALSRDAKGKELSIDLLPDMSFMEAYTLLDKKRSVKNLTSEHLFLGLMNKKVGGEVLRRLNIKPFTKPISQLSDKELKALIKEAKDMRFYIDDTQGFNNAQVTAGGIRCDKFSPDTMESKKDKGLFAIGEVLDVDGDCGGFNLHWAFASAKAVADELGGL